jgi:hypothetical protein
MGWPSDCKTGQVASGQQLRTLALVTASAVALALAACPAEARPARNRAVRPPTSARQEPPPAHDRPLAVRAGRVIGKGTFKVVHEVEGWPDLVLGVERDGSDAEGTPRAEIPRLRELERLGVPVVKVKGEGSYGGKSAYLLERFEASNKDRRWPEQRSRLLNERSLADIERIGRTLEAAGVDVDDFQVMVGKDGRVVVSDPLGVQRRVLSPSTRQALNRLTDETNQAIELRRLDHVIDE